jgi:DNA-binding beta-propeller fold protein YncE
VLHTIPVGLGPHSIAISPDGAQLAVTNTDSNEVSIIDDALDDVYRERQPRHPGPPDRLVLRVEPGRGGITVSR